MCVRGVNGGCADTDPGTGTDTYGSHSRSVFCGTLTSGLARRNPRFMIMRGMISSRTWYMWVSSTSPAMKSRSTRVTFTRLEGVGVGVGSGIGSGSGRERGSGYAAVSGQTNKTNTTWRHCRQSGIDRQGHGAGRALRSAHAPMDTHASCPSTAGC